MHRQLVSGLPTTEGALTLEHLKTSQIKLLLQTENLNSEGSREQLLDRLKTHLVDTLPCEWVMTALDGDGPHREYATVVCYEGDMYLFGGDCHPRTSSQTGAMNAVMKYNMCRGRWEPVICKGTPPCERSGHSAVVYDNKMWVLGGWKWIVSGASGRMFNDMHVLDLKARRWSEVSQKGVVPEPRAWHSVWVWGSTMLLYGDNGECEESKDMVGTVLAFEFNTGTWNHLHGTGEAPLPEMVEGITVWDNVLFALCYSKSTEEEQVMDVYAMDMETFKWTKCMVEGDRPTARIGCSTTVVGPNWILHGGFPMHGQGEILSDTFAFNFDERSWSLIRCGGDVPLPRGGHTAVALANSVVFLEGSTVHNSGRQRYDVQYCSIIEHLWQRPEPPLNDSVLNSDMVGGVRRLYGDAELSDVSLLVGSNTFKAHKALLASSSKVFDRMFRNNVQENETQEVSITDVSSDVFEAMLKYMYGCLGTVEEGQAIELFRASDKYDVEGLRLHCLAVLKQALDVDNIGSFVLLADERSCADLLEACVDYSSTADRFLKVLSSESYLCMLQSNPRLGQKFTQYVAQKAFSSGGKKLAHGTIHALPCTTAHQ